MARKRNEKKTLSEADASQVAPDASIDPQPSFPIVGIGASAGGLEAFEKFFTHMSPDSGMAFVIVQHLDPTHKSILTDLLKKYTRMPVVQVEDKMRVEPNGVYVIPPNRDMALQGNELHLMKPTMPRGLRLPIDFFFRSLAIEKKEKAICIVLSGTATDGTLGLKAIKGEGGLTIVQSPESARYDGMPISAVNTGLVDVVLPPEKIAEQLIDYVKRSFDAEPLHPRKSLPGISDHVQNIFVLLRDHTGHDFSGYKENTISRRIERRMTVNQLAQVEDYLHYLQRTPLEIEILFRELLIGVTSFFRDPEAFEHLDQKVITPLFSKQKGHSRQIRIWVPGCSTGEEAYSIAMLLQEHMEQLKREMDIQVFATDIDQAAIEKAREGIYPDSIAADVSPERLQKYFVKEEDGNHYQIKRQIRDMVVFAVQSVIKDPPFSKLDLLCCRNLMIYLDTELQQRLLSLFHYALNPGSFLFLGNSETLGSSQRYFHTIDQKWRIFQKAQINTDIKTVLEFPSAYLTRRETLPYTLQTDKQMSLREMTEKLLLSEYTPTGIVINEKGEMLYVHGRTGQYLEQTTGEISTNILQIAREDLRMSLSTAIRKVNTHKKPHVIEGITIRTDSDELRIKLTVAPIVKPVAMQGLMLVIFNQLIPPHPVSDEEMANAVEGEQTQHVLELEQELKSTREYLQTMIEELETTNEELKSSNEELQSSNEELQSTNEELQTSKEELQSVNEELVTVNSELQDKVNELTLANNDIKNLLDNAQVGLIFLDQDLRIRRFTPSATKIVDLIAADIGRPLGQFVHKLHYGQLVEDSREVLDTLSLKEMDVQSEDGHWYLVRIMPYRTVDDNIDGVVLTFADVTQLREYNQKLELLFDILPVGVSVIDRKRNIVKQNAQLEKILDIPYEDLASGDFHNRKYLRADGTPMPEDEFASTRVLNGEPAVLNHETGMIKKDGTVTWLNVSATAGPFEDWNTVIVTSDITARKNVEEELRASEEKFSNVFHRAPLMMAISDLHTGTFVDVNQRHLDVSGYSRQELIGTGSIDIGWISLEDRDRLAEMLQADGYVQDHDLTVWTKDKQPIQCIYNGFLMNVQGEPRIVSISQDITVRKRAEKDLEAALEDKEVLLRELSHRTKNNMHVIRSLLSLQAEYTENEEVKRIVNDTGNKIYAMALVHQKLYQSQSLSKIDLQGYIEELVSALTRSYTINPDFISVSVKAEPISVQIDTAIPCGLVITELISNAFKHAFPDNKKGIITIQLSKGAEKNIHLLTSDNGVGVPHEFDFRRQSTLGMQTIFMIVEHQLRGTINFDAKKGLKCDIHFPDTLLEDEI